MQYAIAALAFVGAVAAQDLLNDLPAYVAPTTYEAPAPYDAPSSYEAPSPTTYDVITSTAWATTEHTVYQCPSYVTDCPAESMSVVVVTDTVALYTTICPVTATETPVVYSSAPVYSSEAPVYSSEPAPESYAPPPYSSATNTPVAPGQPQTYTTYGAPSPTYGAASDTAGTVYYPTATESPSVPIATGAAVRAGPAFGGLAVAAAVAMML